MAGFSSTLRTLPTGLVGTVGGVQNLVETGYLLVDSTAVPVGRGVVYDSANSSASVTAAKLPSTTGQKFLGVARINPMVMEIDATLAYQEGETIVAVTNAPLGVWVETTEAVDPSDAVYLQHTLNSGRAPGTFRTDSDSSNADLLDPAVCQWAGVYTSGKALLLINRP